MKRLSRSQDKIIIALDVPNTERALRLLDTLSEPPSWCKIGLELFTAEGPSVVKAVQARGCQIFLDLKFHDIPHTVGRAVQVAVSLGVSMITLHAGGGTLMMEHALQSAQGSSLILLAVTVLTSMDTEQLASTGIHVEPKNQVLRLAQLASEVGISGIVCSPLEISVIRETYGNKLLIVTPGVRPIGSNAEDQKRVMTPAKALKAGADWLVIGRPIIDATNPQEAYSKILEDIT